MGFMANFTMGTGGHYITMLPAVEGQGPSNCKSLITIDKLRLLTTHKN